MKPSYRRLQKRHRMTKMVRKGTTKESTRSLNVGLPWMMLWLETGFMILHLAHPQSAKCREKESASCQDYQHCLQ